jgi:hypothetical protein
LNLLAPAADGLAAEAPAAALGAGFGKFQSNYNDKIDRRNFRRARGVSNSAGEPRNCALQKLQLYNGLATSN